MQILHSLYTYTNGLKSYGGKTIYYSICSVFLGHSVFYTSNKRTLSFLSRSPEGRLLPNLSKLNSYSYSTFSFMGRLNQRWSLKRTVSHKNLRSFKSLKYGTLRNLARTSTPIWNRIARNPYLTANSSDEEEISNFSLKNHSNQRCKLYGRMLSSPRIPVIQSSQMQANRDVKIMLT